MSTIKVNIQGAEQLGEIYDILLEEAKLARDGGVALELSQERGIVEGAIILTIAKTVEPYVTAFLTKLIERIAQNIADRLMSPQPKPIEQFVITINNTRYKLPDELERLRQDQGIK